MFQLSKNGAATYLILVLATLTRLSHCQEAERCDPSYCRLPNCFCGGSEIPGGLKPENTPQFVLLTFDDAVNGLNREFFNKLFKDRVNPNQCPIKVWVLTVLPTFRQCYQFLNFLENT